MQFDLKWLSDPEIFQVNTLPPVSDHLIYASEDEAEAQASSLVRLLDGQWHAHYALKPTEAPDLLITDGSLDSALPTLTVPGEFQLQNPTWDPPHYTNTQYPWDGHEDLKPGEVSSEYNPTVTAIRSFELDEEDLDCGRVVLTFEGVESAVAVYLNGSFVGYSEDSFTPHRFDVTGLLRVGENRLVARVFKRCSGVWMEDQDFWRFSGIHRSVALTFEPHTHLRDLFMRTPLTDSYTRAFLEGELSIDRPDGTVELLLTDADGRVLLQKALKSAESLSLREEVPGVKLWSAEAPNLYDLTVTLKDAMGETAEVSRTRIGFRQFEMIDKIMHLNGKRIVFHGVNRHEFDCDLGRVMTKELLLRDIHDMKSMNVNAVRTCHYPNTSLFYRLCDEYGLYVIDETNIETHGTWAVGDWHGAGVPETYIPGDKAEWLGAVLARGRAMQERDKNHACILLWSCGNESFGGLDLYKLSQMFHARDNTRLVHYEGVANDKRYPDTTDVHSRMYARVAYIEEYLSGNPDKPFVNCEYTHAMGNSCGGMSLYTALEDKYPMYQGGFIWDYVDQGLRVKGPNGQTRLAYGGDFGDKPTDWHFNTNGIILGDRTFTPKVQEVRYLFRDVDLLPDETGVTVRSRRQHADLTGFELHWSTLVEDIPMQEGVCDVPAVHPGESVHIDLPIQVCGETIITAKLCVKEEGGLLERGTMLSVGQAILGQRYVDEEIPMPEAVIPCNSNIGMRGEDYGALLARNEGMISFRDALGRETLLHAPKLSLFRAPTDNDNGNRNTLKQGIYVAMSLCSGTDGARLNGAEVRYEYSAPVLPEVRVPVTYTALRDGVKVTVSWPGVKDLPDLPCLGLQLLMDARLTQVRYLGLGPDENYVDRCEGAWMDWHSYAVKDGWTHYAKPQESGSRMGVRRLLLTGEDGHGVEISGDGLEVSVMPWTPEQLMSCWHPDELVGASRTVLNVAGFRRGVGGDDSWGAPVLPQYCYPADKPYTFSFVIRSI